MKARHLLTVLTLSYVLLYGVSSFMEIQNVKARAEHVQNLMGTAADMALQQTQVSDDFFKFDTGYGTQEDTNEFMIRIVTNNQWEEQRLFEVAFPSASSKQQVFEAMFDTTEFRSWSNEVEAISAPKAYMNFVTGNGFRWYDVPKVAQIGTDLLHRTPAIPTISGAQASELYAKYKMDSYKREGTNTLGNPVDYYYTPLKVGLTYLDRELLGKMFQNNLDILMRSKYTDAASLAESTGIINTAFLGHTIDDSYLSGYDVINDGYVSLVKGQVGAGELLTAGSRLPDVEYKVIDIYDPANDDFLMMIFGPNKGAYVTKARYLYESDRDAGYRDPSTGLMPTKKEVVVAKVTFYADFVIPYTMPLLAEMRASHKNTAADVDKLASLYVHGETAPNALTNVAPSGNDYMEYTRFFVVLP